MRSGTKLVMCVMGLVASQAFGVELVYQVEPGTKLERTTKMEAEFVLLGDIPGFDKIDGGQNGSSKIVFELMEISDGAKVKITGTREIALTLNEMPMDPAYVDVGPATLTIAPTGEILDSTMADFEVTETNLLTLGWLGYIQGQLDMPALLPEGGTIKAGDSWTSTVFVKSPAGGQMNGEAKSRVMGTSWNDGKCAWIYTAVSIPLKLNFKTESGSYKANGTYFVSSVSCFNIDKGFDTERIAFTTAQFQIVAEGEEQSYNIDIMISGKETTKVKVLKEEEEKKVETAAAEGDEEAEEEADEKAEEN